MGIISTDTFDISQMRSDLMRDEGFKLRVYKDNAKPPNDTIGCGRNLTDVGIRPFECHALNITEDSIRKNGLTPYQATFLLDSDIHLSASALDAQYPWWRGMTPKRQRVLLNMTFNMGIVEIAKFKDSLRDMHAGHYADAANDMKNSAWYKQVGDRAKRLVADMIAG